MASRSRLSFAKRAEQHKHPLAKQLFQLAEKKQSNVVVSADLTTTDELLDLADSRCYLEIVMHNQSRPPS